MKLSFEFPREDFEFARVANWRNGTEPRALPRIGREAAHLIYDEERERVVNRLSPNAGKRSWHDATWIRAQFASRANSKFLRGNSNDNSIFVSSVSL